MILTLYPRDLGPFMIQYFGGGIRKILREVVICDGIMLTTSKTEKAFHKFLELPPELREMIYSEYLKGTTPFTRPSKARQLRTNLMSTSKLIYWEAKEVYIREHMRSPDFLSEKVFSNMRELDSLRRFLRGDRRFTDMQICVRLGSFRVYPYRRRNADGNDPDWEKMTSILKRSKIEPVQRGLTWRNVEAERVSKAYLLGSGKPVFAAHEDSGFGYQALYVFGHIFRLRGMRLCAAEP